MLKIHPKSDIKFRIYFRELGNGKLPVFEFRYFTTDKNKFIKVGFDGQNYINCTPCERGVVASWECPSLYPGMLRVLRYYPQGDAQFEDGVFDVIRAERTNIEISDSYDSMDYSSEIVEETVFSQGEQGSQGARGLQGERGFQGEQGLKGDKGDQGAKGDKGDSGERGLKGDKGERGDQGLKGEKGDKGDKGDGLDYSTMTPEEVANIKGVPGDRGEKGDKGDPFTYADFTPYQLESLKVKGDQGAKGDKGDPGTSAYQSAVSGGYSGSQVQFGSDLADIATKTLVNYTVNTHAGNSTHVTSTEKNTWNAKATISDINAAVNGIQIESPTRNYLPKKYLYKFNTVGSVVTKVGSDSYGDYFNINPYNITEYVAEGLKANDIFFGKISFQANTQYAFSIKWRQETVTPSEGLKFVFHYTDGTSQGVAMSKTQTTPVTSTLITAKGKTVSKISCTYTSYSNTYIYDIQLTKGTQVVDWFMAEEDRVLDPILGEEQVVPGEKWLSRDGVTFKQVYYKVFIGQISSNNTIFYESIDSIAWFSGMIYDSNVCVAPGIYWDVSIDNNGYLRCTVLNTAQLINRNYCIQVKYTRP